MALFFTGGGLGVRDPNLQWSCQDTFGVHVNIKKKEISLIINDELRRTQQIPAKFMKQISKSKEYLLLPMISFRGAGLAITTKFTRHVRDTMEPDTGKKARPVSGFLAAKGIANNIVCFLKQNQQF